MKKQRCSVEKIYGDIITLIPDDGGDVLKISLNDHALSENDIVDVTVENGLVTDVSVCREETLARLERNRSRLHSLFGKNKK